MMCLYNQRTCHKDIEDLVFTSKTNNPINVANIKDSINYIVDRINRENPEQLDQNATAPTARQPR